MLLNSLQAFFHLRNRIHLTQSLGGVGLVYSELLNILMKLCLYLVSPPPMGCL